MLRTLALCLALLPLAACGADSDSGDSYADDMRREHDGETSTASGAADGFDSTGLSYESVLYGVDADGDSLQGTMVYPSGVPDAPGVIVIHEWWGLNDNVVNMAARLASEGYAALAVDLYGGEAASDPDGAMALMQAVDETAAVGNLTQAYAFLAERGAPAIGSVGWCFGGGMSLQTALALPTELDAAVIYYGQPVTDAGALAPLQMPVLGLFGADDPSFPPDMLEAFEAALTDAGVAHEIEVYPGADHAFANPSGDKYQPEAAQDAWARTTAFFAEHLR